MTAATRTAAAEWMAARIAADYSPDWTVGPEVAPYNLATVRAAYRTEYGIPGMATVLLESITGTACPGTLADATGHPRVFYPAPQAYAAADYMTR